jgi:hypothetical protein
MLQGGGRRSTVSWLPAQGAAPGPGPDHWPHGVQKVPDTVRSEPAAAGSARAAAAAAAAQPRALGPLTIPCLSPAALYAAMCCERLAYISECKHLL